MMTKDDSSHGGTASLEQEEGSSLSAGRLKFFKEGRCLLELSHRNGRNWCPITKKVYWPPSFPPSSACDIKRETLASALSSPTEAFAKEALPPPLAPKALRKSTHPRRRAVSAASEDEVSFSMRPPAHMFALRKKMRGLKKKTRCPYAGIRVGAYLLRVEASACSKAVVRKRAPLIMDRIRQSSRLERLISKLPRITIRSWAPPSNKPALHIKSAASMLKAESFYPLVDAIASSGVAPPPKGPLRIKAATKTISAESPRVASTAKSLPVTPTIARIKTEPLHQAVPSPLHSSGSLLLTPDMKRVKVEISGSSPDRSFGGSPPRKRHIDALDAASSPSHLQKKRHRLSTDSLGGSREGSPYVPASPPPPRVVGGGRMSSFSIDSLISRDDESKKPSLPGSPSRLLGDMRREEGESCLSHGSRSPTPLSLMGSPAPPSRRGAPLSPPLVSITPYASRNAERIDPRLGPQLAHLAGLAADPRLGLTPTGGPYSLVNPYSYLLPLMQQQQLQQSSTTGGSSNPFGHAGGRLNWPPSSSTPGNGAHRGNTNTAWPGQYRGEPKIASVELGRQSPDAPLNLSLK